MQPRTSPFLQLRSSVSSETRAERQRYPQSRGPGGSSHSSPWAQLLEMGRLFAQSQVRNRVLEAVPGRTREGHGHPVPDQPAQQSGRSSSSAAQHDLPLQVSRRVGHLSAEDLLEVGASFSRHRQHSKATVQARHSRGSDEQQWTATVAQEQATKAAESHPETN